MSALSTPSGGGTTAQSKPTSGKQKYQKLDINSLYCTNRNENSEPSSVKSQLSRKHGMQSLGKVPSTRRPPANLPSLRTETGQDSNANCISTTTTSVTSPPTCISQTMPTTAVSGAVAAAGSGGWVPLPPPSSPHFRTEFPSLEAAAQPAHRPDHTTPQPQLRPQTEGSWTSGGSAGVRPEAAASPAAAAAPAAAVQTPAYRAILPSFLVKGSSGGGLGLGGLALARETPRGGPAPRGPPRAPATPRAVELLTARPILREEQISSLDDMSRDAGWAQHDDIDYDQKLDFSDGESSAPNKGNNRHNNRASIESERAEKMHEPGDEDQLWAERRQKQNNEVAQAVARARQRKEEEQRRQMRDPPASLPSKDFRDKGDRDRNDNRERDPDSRDKERIDPRDRDVRDRMDRQDIRDKDRNDQRDRDVREKDRTDNRDRMDNRDRFDNRDRERDVRDRDRDREKVDSRDRGRNDNRDRMDRQDVEKERMDGRDRERIDNRDRIDNRERSDRDRFDRERDRTDRERERDRDRERERGGDRERNERDRDREREFRDRDARDRDVRDRDTRDRDYNRERDQNNPAFSKSFQANIPPRFLKQQQNRQQDEPQHKGWAFSGKPAPRRQEAPPYNNAQRHPPQNGRRSYSRDYSDREDDFRRDKDGSGPQWRSEMQDYERSGRELDRSNSKDSYKDFSDYKGKNDSDRKTLETAIDPSSRSAAEKLSEVFERKSIGIIEPFVSSDSSQAVSVDRRSTPPSNVSRRESSEKDCTKTTSWAEASQEESNNVLKSAIDKVAASMDSKPLCPDTEETKHTFQLVTVPPPATPASNYTNNAMSSQNQSKFNTHTPVFQPMGNNIKQQHLISLVPIVHSQPIATVCQVQTPILDTQNSAKLIPQSISNTLESFTSQIQKQASEHLPQSFAKALYPQKSDKDVEIELISSKPSTDPTPAMKMLETPSTEVAPSSIESAKRPEDKRNDAHGNYEHVNRIPSKEPIERKSSGSGSEKKSRGFGGGGYAVYNRGWGPRESRGRRAQRSSRSNNRASESDGSTDGTLNAERKERRRAPRSPRGPKKPDRAEESRGVAHEPPLLATDGMENREPFAPRGQPSRRGRGGFQGTSRPPAPAKRVTGYGPPNTKSPFSQANRAVKENEEPKDNLTLVDDKGRGNNNKPRTGSSTGRGRDRRPKGAGGPLSGEEDNWETTSEHSEGGGTGGRRRSVPGRHQVQTQKGQGGRNQNPRNPNNARGNAPQGVKKDSGDNKTADITEAMTDLKLSNVKKEDEVVDDGFQEVRNKKNSKDARGPLKDENQQASKQQPRSHSNQGGGRNGSSSRNPNDKSNSRGSAQVPGKNPQFDRQRQASLAPRFVKQRQKQQLGVVGGYGPDTGAAPPPPAVNAWDKPLRGAPEEPLELAENKSAHSSQRSTPAEVLNDAKPVPPPIAVPGDKSGVLDGTTPPVETIIFENTNYKTIPSEEALQQKYQMNSNIPKPQTEEILSAELEARALPFNGDVRSRTRSIQELIGDTGRPATDGEGPLGLQMQFDTAQKAEDSSDIKLDFTFDSDLGQLTEDKSAKTLGMPRSVHMSASNTISPLAADLDLKIASVKKVWEMPAVAEGGEEMQYPGFEESGAEAGAPPNVCKVKPTQQLQSPPPQLYNHVGYQGGYGGGLSVPSPPAMLFNSTQQLPAQGGLYGAFLDQGRGQFGGFPPAPYATGSPAPYNFQPPPDMFQSLPNQYRMAATAGGGAAFGQSGQLGNSPSTVLISSSSNSLMSATVKPSSQQIGAIGSKGGGVGGVGGVGSVSAYQQQYLGYGAPDAGYSLQGLVPRAPASSYYSYQPAPAQQPSYPLQFTQPAQSQPYNSQFLSSAQLQVAAAVQQMQQQYRAPMQQQYAPPQQQQQQRPPPQQQQQQLKSPLHEHANGFAPLCDAASPTPKGAAKGQKAPHSPPHHKYHAPPHPPPSHTPHQLHPQQMVSGGNGGRCGGGGGPPRSALVAPRYPAPIQRPHAPALPMYRAPAHPPPPPRHHAPRANPYYQHHQRNGGGGGGGGGERAPETGETAAGADEPDPAPAPDAPPQPDLKAE